MLLRQKLRRI